MFFKFSSKQITYWYFVIVLIHSSIQSQRKSLYIGGFFPLSPNKASVPGRALLAAAELALRHVNQSNLLTGYELRMVVKDSKCDPAYSASKFMDLLAEQPNTLMILAAACSDVTELLAELSAYRQLAQISYASRSLALSNRVKYPTLFRTLPSESARNHARVAWIEHHHWNRVATLFEKTNSDTVSLSNNQIITELNKLNKTVLLSEEITGKQLELKMQTLMRNDARIIVGTFYEKKARHVFCQAFKSGLFGPRFVWILIGTYSSNWWRVQEPSVTCTLDEMREAVAYSFIFNNQISLNDKNREQKRAISGLTPSEYYMQYTELLRTRKIPVPRNITAYAYDAVWVIASALNKSIPKIQSKLGSRVENFTYGNENVTQVFIDAIQDVRFQGVTGEVSFFENGDRYDGMVEILQQLPDGNTAVVGYFDPKKKQLELVGKGNLWPDGKVPGDVTKKRREFIQVPMWLYIVMCLLSSLGIVLALVFLAFNIRFRNKRYIKLSSPTINNFIILGCVMLYSSVFLYGLDGRLSDFLFTVVCRARLGLLTLGFTVAFGAMFSKTWRVHQIFTNVKKIRRVVRDSDLIRLLTLFVLVDVVALSLWMILHPPSRKIVELYGQTRLSEDRDYEIVLCREECIGPHSTAWLVTFYAFHSLMLVFGLFLAFETRKVTISVLNDSRFIGISVYNVVLLCAIGVPVSYISTRNPTVGYCLICAVILFCTSVTLSVLFIPKAIKMWKDPNGNPLKKGQFLSTLHHRPSNNVNSHAPHGAGHVNNIHHLEIDNQTFKAGELHDLEARR